VSRLERAGDAIRRSVLLTVGLAAALALVAGIAAWAADRDVSATVAAAYYIVGCGVFLIGMFPTGGFSLRKRTMTPRRPIGSRFEPIVLAGPLLVGLGVLIDITRPV
jgi:hypothetical protein